MESSYFEDPAPYLTYENNGYVIYKWNIHGSTDQLENRVVVKGGGGGVILVVEEK
jgi:hypothetical protein